MSVRVGLVGVGSMGKNHLRLLSEHPDVELVAIADKDTKLRKEAVSRHGCKGYNGAEKMIEGSDLDAIVVASPTVTHTEVAMLAIRSGIPALIEKPLASTYEAAYEIFQLSEKLGVPVQVGHVERYNPAVLLLGELLKSGMISEVYSATSTRAGPFPERIRDVGVTIDLATHDVDILSWIIGERPARAYAESTRQLHAVHEDLTFGLLKFPSGKVGMLDVNWLTPAKRRSLRVLGKEGMFELDYLTQELRWTQAGTSEPILVDGYAPTLSGVSTSLPITKKEPLLAQLDEFLDVVRTGKRPYVNAEDGAWAVRIAQALLSSSIEGTPVYLR